MRSIHLIAFFLTLLLTVTGARVSLAQAQSSLVHSPQTKPHPLNLDFEEGKLGQVPDGWDCPTKVSYSAELTDKQPKSGKRVAVLHSVSTTAVGSSFGNLMQAMDATAFRGRRVRFKAYVRIEANEDEGVARLWLRVDRTEGRRGFFDNMPPRNPPGQEYPIGHKCKERNNHLLAMWTSHFLSGVFLSDSHQLAAARTWKLDRGHEL